MATPSCFKRECLYLFECHEIYGCFELGAKTSENTKLAELENRMLALSSEAKQFHLKIYLGQKQTYCSKHNSLDSNERLSPFNVYSLR